MKQVLQPQGLAHEIMFGPVTVVKEKMSSKDISI